MRRTCFIIVIIGFIFSCDPQEDQSTLKKQDPSVTIGAESISAVSALLCGEANIESTISSDMTMGVMFSTNSGVLPSNSTKIVATDINAKQGTATSYSYKVSVKSLTPATSYYYRSYISQNGQDTYGESKEFKTKEISSMLRTQDASSITAEEAVLNASLDLTNVQYSNINYGFEWSTSDTTHFTRGIVNNLNNGSYNRYIHDLSHNTKYRFRAYVELDGQDLYGDFKSFTTGNVPVESVSLNNTDYTFNNIGDSLNLIVTISPENATDKSVIWSTNNESVATIDENGIVKAVGNGTAYITVITTDQRKTAECSIIVSQKVTKITIPTSLSLEEGQEQILSAYIYPDNAKDTTVTWSTTNSSVALVDSNGKVKAVSNGVANIKAVANDGSGISASCNVKVSYPCPEGAIDLGLTKNGFKIYWSKYNLGESGLVSSPEEFGAYYSWGETEAKNDYYNWDNYKWCNGTYQTLTKYNSDRLWGTVVDNKTVLEADDDAARKKLGGRWRMPTVEEWIALRDSCSRVYTTLNGVYGMLFTASNGNSIFIPAADNKGAPRYSIEDPAGNYWTTSLSTAPYSASAFYFNSNGATNIISRDRYCGLPIRPVSY